MDNPTTVFPWRTSSAATVELSTPPDIATAMGALLESSSGMDGNAAQVRHRGFERLCQPIHLGGGVGAAQRKTHAGAGAIRVEPDGGERVRWRDGAARARRAGRNGEAAQVERDHQRFPIHAVEM